ncbi:glycine n-acyltransferase-like protein [Lasius niger]|uniref:Glycine n-acyltransferase-like protein n=1 Tax=Lasius niger TaxID=67767 RepID=A0A0J7NL86_LASNI|nr:glycine n-acyltransferase-like protein [Lasius niger]
MECPEAVERGRNFRLLAEEELSNLLDFLTGYLPDSLKPNGLVYESVGVFCPNDRLELLRLLREEDVLIDWSRPLYINFVHCGIAEELTRLYEGTGTIETVVGDVCACDVVEQEEKESQDDPDVQVLPLKSEHAEGIHELYPANDMECHELFLRLIRTLPAAGVFAKGSLAAWMVQSYYGAMFSMQTKPEYRRKGYGTKLARYLTKRVAERGYYPFVVIRPENEASQSLYKKLGFRRLYQLVRMIFMPFMWQEGESDSNILRDNLENAVRQLTIEQRVITALCDQEESEETIRDLTGTAEDESIVDKSEGEEEGEEEGEKELLETIEEQPEERINTAEDNDTVAEDVPEVVEVNGSCDCDGDE